MTYDQQVAAAVLGTIGLFAIGCGLAFVAAWLMSRREER